MIVARLTSPPALAAVVLAALLVSVMDDWAAGDGLWIVLQLAAVLIAATYLLARLLGGLGLLEREADADLLERTCNLLRLPATASALLFLAITLDPHISSIASKPRQISYPVMRIPCVASGLRPTVAVQDGQICLRRDDNRFSGLAHPSSVERVDLALVPAGMALGAKGRLFAEEVQRGLLTKARFARPVALKRA